jgi:hypothetical protein
LQVAGYFETSREKMQDMGFVGLWFLCKKGLLGKPATCNLVAESAYKTGCYEVAGS